MSAILTVTGEGGREGRGRGARKGREGRGRGSERGDMTFGVPYLSDKPVIK